jgi:hypothetical protein
MKMETVRPSEMSEHWSTSWCRYPKEDPSIYPMFIWGSCFTGKLTKKLAAWWTAAVALSCQPTATQNRTPLQPATANPPTRGGCCRSEMNSPACRFNKQCQRSQHETHNLLH